MLEHAWLVVVNEATLPLRSRSVRLARAAAVVIATAALSSCGGGVAAEAEISADTKCSDYLQRSSEDRHSAAVRISASIAGVSSPGNPMWGLSLDGACGSSPDMTIGQYFRRDS